jgi:DNA replication protein DnaC
MKLELIQERLEELGLIEMARVLESRVEQASKSDWSYLEFIEKLLTEESLARKERSLRTRTRLSKIPVVKSLEDFDFEAQPGVDRKQIHELATLGFIDRTDNVCLLGPPGVGKSHLAISLALRALEEGYTAYFTTLDGLVQDLKRAEAHQSLQRRLSVYLKPRVLVLDEIGYLPLDRQAGNWLFQLVSRRYEQGSIILTSNKSYGDWGAFLGDTVLATAILDRLLHHSVTVNIRGESYRLKNRRKAGLMTVPAAKEVAPAD